MITSSDVGARDFEETRFREGYDQDEVDTYLTEIAATLASYERPTMLASYVPLRSEDVVLARFQPTKFRPGYDQDEVDDFLDDIVSSLREHEARKAGG